MSPVRIYVDESYFYQQSGVIQCAIPITVHAEPNACTAIESIRDAFPYLMPPEFKASAISNGNAAVYKEFLQRVVNIISQVTDQCSLRAIVTFESMDRHRDHNAEWIKSQVAGALQKLGDGNHQHLAAEFSRQIWWIYRFFERLCPTGMQNSIEFVCDNKHRYAQECSSLAAVDTGLGVPLLVERGELLAKLSNTLLAQLPPVKRFPRVDRFTFEFSQSKRFLQACDLFANLFLNAVKYENGISDETTVLKYELLRAIVPDLNMSVISGVRLDAVPDKGLQIICVDPKMSGSMRIAGL